MRRIPTPAALALVCVAALAALAGAQFAEGEAASNFHARLLSVTPQPPRLDVAVIENSTRMEVTNTTGDDLIVAGYQDEPYLRVGPDGVAVNLRSPATYLNKDRQGTTTVPGSVDPDAEPEWSQVSDGQTARWHDHRVHWMGTLDPPVVQQKPERRHTIIPEWVVRMRVGGTTIEVTGDLVWVPGPSTTPWWTVAVAAFAVTVAAALTRARRPALAAAVAILVTADLVNTLGVVRAGAGGNGSQLARVVTGVPVSVAGWVAGCAAVVLLVRGHDVRRHEAGAYAAAVAGLLIGAYGGLAEMAGVGRSQILFAWPDDLFRLATALSVGLGFGVVVVVATPALRQVMRQPGKARVQSAARA